MRLHGRGRALVVAAAWIGVALGWDSPAVAPPLGWNSNNYWGCGVNASVLMQAADAMVPRPARCAAFSLGLCRFVHLEGVCGGPCPIHQWCGGPDLVWPSSFTCCLRACPARRIR